MHPDACEEKFGSTGPGDGLRNTGQHGVARMKFVGEIAGGALIDTAPAETGSAHRDSGAGGDDPVGDHARDPGMRAQRLGHQICA